ncbi:DUF4335 domain-containing protein [Thermosynechococcaceae cyanobacterium Okahandja]
MSTTLSYHQPTCQLEVAAEFLPLSQTLPRSLHFNLQVGQHLTLAGNDRQLYYLKRVVNTYIDTLLSRRVTPVVVREAGICLESRSPLEHELHWPEQTAIILKLSELYDLVTVLDEWSAAMQPLPELVATSHAKLAQIPIWLKSTAVAVGLLAAFSLAQQWLPSSPLSSASRTDEQASLPPLATPLPFPEPPANPELAPLPTTPEPPDSPTELIPLPPPPAMPPPAALPPSVAVKPDPVPEQDQTPDLNPDQNNVVVETPPNRAPAGISAVPAVPITPPASSRVSATTLQEVKTYFQDRWQPPPSLDTSLEYRLVINPDGTLAQALPLNGAAVRFIDRTPIPLRESPLASPFSGDQPVLLRLVLMPSGSVQLFDES